MEHEGRHIPNTLRRHRKIWNYTQKDVARILGHKDTGHLSQWERGEVLPSLINLLKLSIIYQTLPTELYFELYSELRESIFVQFNGKRDFLATEPQNLSLPESSGDNSED